MPDAIRLKTYNHETWRYEETGQEVSMHSLAHSLSPEQVADLLGSWANAGGKEFQEGQAIGQALWREHRYLQHLVVQMCVGILHEMGRQKWSDARNEFSLKVCRGISALLERDFNYWFRDDEAS